MTAYTNLTVEITAEIIAQSQRRNSGHCMIADAVRAAAPGVQAVSVDIQTIRFTDSHMRTRMVYLTPRSAQQALIRFDQGQENEPFVIKLRNPHYVPLTDRPRKTKTTANLDSTEGSTEGSTSAPTADAGVPGKPEGRNKRSQPAAVSGGIGGGRPRRQGGDAPPTAALAHRSGQRREFGLKVLPR
jgi:hypothetical protein